MAVIPARLPNTIDPLRPNKQNTSSPMANRASIYGAASPRRRPHPPPPPPHGMPPPPHTANGGEQEHMEPQDKEPQGRGGEG